MMLPFKEDFNKISDWTKMFMVVGCVLWKE